MSFTYIQYKNLKLFFQLLSREILNLLAKFLCPRVYVYNAKKQNQTG